MKATAMLETVRAGGKIHIITHTRHTIIDRKCLLRFEKSGAFLFGDDGNNFRMASGKNRVYVFAANVQIEEARP